MIKICVKMIPDGGKSNLTDYACLLKPIFKACSCRYGLVFTDIADIKEDFGKLTEVWATKVKP